MRDAKSLLLLLVSLLLVLVSFVLIWTWGYNFYRNNNEAAGNAKTAPADSAAIVSRLKDSLQREFNASLQDLDQQLNLTLSQSDSLKTALDHKLAEFYRLRSEIVSILKSRNTAGNFSEAKKKIGEFQIKVADLKEKNQEVEKENNKLNEVLNQISGTEKKADKNGNTTGAVKSIPAERPLTGGSAFLASELRLAAIMNTGETETETTVAEKTAKFNASFTIVNYNSQQTNAEMIVVVLGPDGRVLKNSSWDSGTFTTPGGKKVYSWKFSFNYSMGEVKRLGFSLKAADLNRGNYTMEVYHNGLMIARTVKTLT